MRVTLRTDPHINNGHKRVSPGEMERIHKSPDDASSEGLTVAVQDSGLDQTHPRIQQQVNSVEFHDFTGRGEGDEVGHGTLVTDLTTRVAPGADVVPLRVFGQKGSGGFEPFRKSFEWAIEHADQLDAIVMSWGVPGKQVPQIDEYVNQLATNGVIPFAAAGNSGGATGSPATAKHAVSIGALTRNGESMTNFSSWDQTKGPGEGFAGVPEVSAIGQSVMGARAQGTSMGHVIDADTTVASGTSFSNPFVANVGLDLLRRNPNLTAQQMVTVLERTSANIEQTHRDGHGRVFWTEAVKAAKTITQPEEPDKDQPDEKADLVSGTVWSLPFSEGNDWVQLDADVLESGEYLFDAQTLKQAAQKQPDQAQDGEDA